MSNPVGRPTLYRPEYAEQARKLCLLGYRDKDLAEFFTVDISTINRWKVEHDDFRECVFAGKDIADGDVVDSLFTRAKGYDRVTRHQAIAGGQIVMLEETKHIPPDPTSIKFWLTNRQRKLWSERTESAFTDSEGNSLPPPNIIITGVKARDPTA
jgi:hypothetical protein